MIDPKTILSFNGINGSTGSYLQEPLPLSAFTQQARGLKINPKDLGDLKQRSFDKREAKYAVKEGVDPKDLAQAGWGVIFHKDESPAIVEALRPLLNLRRTQANKTKPLYKEYSGDIGYYPGDDKLAFLTDPSRGGSVGPVDPDKVPYYLLIVGGPEKIPYSFQYQLDVQYAVGRIAFDTPADYARYAANVVAAETPGNLKLARRAAFFGTANPDDGSTQLSAEHLVQPLIASTAADKPRWTINPCLRADATKSKLTSLLGGNETPAFLFTASHGMWLGKNDTAQREVNGALVCQDWPGPLQWPKNTAVPPEHFFTGSDIASGANLLGLISMHFACFGGGTPSLSDYPNAGQAPAAIANTPFVARLPQKLLLTGALAVVAHIERAWSYSFVWDGAGQQLAVFQSTLKRLMEGHPVGSAMEYFNIRYAELSTELTNVLGQVGKQGIDDRLAAMWTWNNDARGFIVLGDPAVKLMAGDEDTVKEMRPAVEQIAVTTEPRPAAESYGLFRSTTLPDSTLR